MVGHRLNYGHLYDRIRELDFDVSIDELLGERNVRGDEVVKYFDQLVEDGDDVDVDKAIALIDRVNLDGKELVAVCQIMAQGYQMWGAGALRNPSDIPEAQHYQEVRAYALKKRGNKVISTELKWQ